MPAPLNNAQLEILKLFPVSQSEEDLIELKSLLVSYLAAKMIAEADKAFDSNGYGNDIFEVWRKEHMRKDI